MKLKTETTETKSFRITLDIRPVSKADNEALTPALAKAIAQAILDEEDLLWLSKMTRTPKEKSGQIEKDGKTYRWTAEVDLNDSATESTGWAVA